MTAEWVLAIRIRQFGDVLATLGALRAIKAYRPERGVAFVADAAFHDLLGRFDFIDLLLPTPPGADGIAAYRRYLQRVRDLTPAVALDFHGSARSALLARLSGAPVRAGFDVRIRKQAYTIVEPRAEFEEGRPVKRTSLESALALARHAGVADGDGRVMPEITIDDAERQRATRAMIDAGVSNAEIVSGNVVGLNPGRPYPAKEWSPVRFVALARRLVSAGKTVVVLWGPGEEAAAKSIVNDAGANVFLSPKSSLNELPASLKTLAAVVTIDSGLKHLAVSVRVPTLTLFGSTDPREWHMGTGNDRFLWKGYSCSPCRRLTCAMGAPCMDFSVDDVVDAMTTEGSGWIHAASR